MEDKLENPLAGIEQLLMKLPMGSTPTGRVLLFGGAGGAFAYFVRPSISFNPDGSPKPWIMFDANNSNATLFPYWAWIVVPGVLFGVFV